MIFHLKKTELSNASLTNTISTSLLDSINNSNNDRPCLGGGGELKILRGAFCGEAQSLA